MSDKYNTIQNKLKQIFNVLSSPLGRVQRFSYTDQVLKDALDGKDITKNLTGVESYDYNQEQNIPLATHTDTDNTMLDKGVRGQSSSITRNFQNHFIGRLSFNMNIVAHSVLSLLDLINDVYLSNISTYDKSKQYNTGDIVTIVVNSRGTGYTKTFQNINSCSNIPPTNPANWVELKDDTVNPVEVSALNCDEITWSSKYKVASNVDKANLIGLPDIPDDENDLLLITENFGNSKDDGMVYQKLFCSKNLRTYKRIFTIKNGQFISVQDWFLMNSKEKAEVMTEAFWFIMEVREDGNLYVIYKEKNPDLVLVKDETDADYGHLIINFEG